MKTEKPINLVKDGPALMAVISAGAVAGIGNHISGQLVTLVVTLVVTWVVTCKVLLRWDSQPCIGGFIFLRSYAQYTHGINISYIMRN